MSGLDGSTAGCGASSKLPLRPLDGHEAKPDFAGREDLGGSAAQSANVPNKRLPVSVVPLPVY